MGVHRTLHSDSLANRALIRPLLLGVSPPDINSVGNMSGTYQEHVRNPLSESHSHWQTGAMSENRTATGESALERIA